MVEEGAQGASEMPSQLADCNSLFIKREMRLTCLAETGFNVHKDMFIKSKFVPRLNKFPKFGSSGNRHTAMVKL